MFRMLLLSKDKKKYRWKFHSEAYKIRRLCVWCNI